MTIDNTIQKPFPIQKLIENGGPYSSLVLEYLSVEDRLAFTRTSKTIHQLAPFQYLPREIEDKFGQVPGPEAHAIAEVRRILNEKKLTTGDILDLKKFPFVSSNDFAVSSLEERFQGNLCTRLIQKVRYYTGYEYAILAKRLAEMAKSKLAEFNEIEKSIPSPLDTIRRLRNSLVRAYRISREIQWLCLAKEKAYTHFVNHKSTLPWLMAKIAQMGENILFRLMKVEDHVDSIKNIKKNVSDYESDRLTALNRIGKLLRGRTQLNPDNKWGFEILKTEYKAISIGIHAQMDDDLNEFNGEAPRFLLIDLAKEASADDYLLGKIKIYRYQRQDRDLLCCLAVVPNSHLRDDRKTLSLEAMHLLLFEIFGKSKAQQLLICRVGWYGNNCQILLQSGFEESDQTFDGWHTLSLDRSKMDEALRRLIGPKPSKSLLPDKKDFLPCFW